MNWKQFLKPDRRKIITIIILLILLALTIPFIMYYSPLMFTIIPMLIIFPIFFDVNNYSKIILLIAYWYLLSCLIVWVYDKLFRKKKK